MSLCVSKPVLIFLCALLSAASSLARGDEGIKPDAEVHVLSQSPTAIVFQAMVGDEPTTHTITVVSVCTNEFPLDHPTTVEVLLKSFGEALPALHDGVWEFSLNNDGYPIATMAEAVLRNKSPASAAIVFGELNMLEEAIAPCRYPSDVLGGTVYWIVCRQGPKTVLLRCPNPPGGLLYQGCGFFRELIEPADVNRLGD